MKNFILSISFILGLNMLVLGQNIEGTIVDEQNLPIQDAYIIKNQTTEHTHSNEMGHFQFANVQIGDTLNISFLGFENTSYVLEAADFEKSLKITLMETRFDLDQVVVSNQLRSLNQISSIDLKTNPVNSSQEILRKVPGLFIAQHAGGGKAEQLFLRGFDIDHGTDISISVDGMPVNMVSHAHGQGYADLHFLIPETIEKIDFGKGPYYSDKGNFNTAGYVEFQTKERLKNSEVAFTTGQFNTNRLLAMINLLGNEEKHAAYVAGEYLLSDGPFESPQNFNRVNLMAKYTINLPENDKLSILASHFQSKWDASGQIPQRAVDNGLISRFGAIDDTEGGSTGRTNFAINHIKNISRKTFLKSNVYFSKYNFELFSNFTFFLDDPINGDQIKQRENRNIFGLESRLLHQIGSTDFQFGLGLRNDKVLENELSHTLNRRETLEYLALGDVDESNIYGFANAEIDLGKVIINPGLRIDHFKSDYIDALAPSYQTLSEQKTILSPKLNFLFNPSPYWQLYLKTGKGFHSNDTRVVVAQNGRDILPAAYGADLGFIWKPQPRLWINTALWYLFLEQEFVYVGDAGVVEPSGKSRRMGLDLGLRYQLNDWLFFDTDINYTLARAIDEPEDANYIPLAPDFTGIGGLSFKPRGPFSGSIRYRYIKDRPANEDNSIIAEGYFLLDATANYRWKQLNFSLIAENILNTDWNEAQFATLSRLQNEPTPVEELHFTPGVPFFVKGSISFRF